MREILAGYLDTKPELVAFQYGERGKPQTSGLKFNVSHSGGLAVYAFTRDREIGVDVEEIRADIAREQIAERFFSANEVRVIRSAPEKEQALRFFRCWTRKEAYVKALAEGLTIPLNSFDVSIESLNGWRVRSFDVGPKLCGRGGRRWRRLHHHLSIVLQAAVHGLHSGIVAAFLFD